MVAAPNSTGTRKLLQRARQASDSLAIDELFARHRERLRKTVRVRLDGRLRGRISSTRVLDDVRGDLSRRLADYDPTAGRSFFLWLRDLVGRRIDEIHRQHFGEQHEAAADIRLHRGALPEVTAATMAARLLDGRGSNPSGGRTQTLFRLQEALDALAPADREVLALRNFEELTGDEVAAVLDLTKAAATLRYVQAAKRLNEILAAVPGFFPPGRT